VRTRVTVIYMDLRKTRRPAIYLFFLLVKIVGCRLVASAIRTYSVHIILVTSRHIEEEDTRKKKKAGKPERIAEEQWPGRVSVPSPPVSRCVLRCSAHGDPVPVDGARRGRRVEAGSAVISWEW
jgi:hypothetical protein